jgi:hypothetical protein
MGPDFGRLRDTIRGDGNTKLLQAGGQMTGIKSMSLLLMLVLSIFAILHRATPIVLAGPDDADKNSAMSSKVQTGKPLTGKATSYPDMLNGHKTSSGEIFHQSGHTAASNGLPLGTKVKVTNLENGKSTDVRVTDRGPALGKHKIDLSKRAAKDIGLSRRQGRVPVAIHVTQPRSIEPQR